MSYADDAKRETWAAYRGRRLVRRAPVTPRILGNSPALRRAIDAVGRVAPTQASVVLRGESGTGKELFARLLHARSGRLGAFIPVNCAALPEHIVESTLFGHRRGAFTGATEAAPGLALSADGGTLFLDEVGDLPLPVQAKLLRMLQGRTVLAVGDVRERPVDLRVVTASHRDLRDLVADGRFRADLYYRLACFELEVPPLRDRARDVVVIARVLLRQGQHGAPPRHLARGAEAVLVRHGWPGNVRELENVLFRAAIEATAGTVTAAILRGVIGGHEVVRQPPATDRVLEVVVRCEGAASGEVAATLSMPASSVKRILGHLVAVGAIERAGRGRAVRYSRATTTTPVDEREQAALRIVAEQGRVTRLGLARAAGVSTRTAGRTLQGLVRRGVVVADGQTGSSGGYLRAG